MIKYVFVWCFPERETDMKSRRTNIILLASLLLTITGCQLIEKRPSKPDLSGIDRIVEEEIEKGNVPGAVVLVGQGNTVLYRKAFGHEVNEPFEEEMSKNTIFDLASLTKPVATATSILILADRGKIELDDYAGKFLPAFACNGKEQVRLQHLLNHTSGLPAFTLNSTGGFSFGYSLGVNACNCPLNEQENEFQWVGNVTHTFGNHSFKFGGDLRYAQNLRVPSDSHRPMEVRGEVS